MEAEASKIEALFYLKRDKELTQEQIRAGIIRVLEGVKEEYHLNGYFQGIDDVVDNIKKLKN